jgi:hypothetical protein
MVYAIDKFSDSNFTRLEQVVFRYAYFPRVKFEQVQKKSINKFVVNSDDGIQNLFNYISESNSALQLSQFGIPINADEEQRSNVKVKSIGIVNKYLGVEGNEQF